MKVIWKSGRRYTYYDTYDTKEEAINEARRQKKIDKRCKSFIINREKGFWFPYPTYDLYLTHAFTLLR